MIIIIRGPSGAGKSTACKELAKLHKPSIVISLDEMRHWVTDWTFSDNEASLALQSAVSTAQIYHDNGYTVFIDHVFLNRWEYDKLVESIDLEESKIKLFTLTADLEMLIKRDNSLPDNLKMGRRVETLYAEFQNSDEDRGVTIDTTSMTVSEVVEIITGSQPSLG